MPSGSGFYTLDLLVLTFSKEKVTKRAEPFRLGSAPPQRKMGNNVPPFNPFPTGAFAHEQSGGRPQRGEPAAGGLTYSLGWCMIILIESEF